MHHAIPLAACPRSLYIVAKCTKSAATQKQADPPHPGRCCARLCARALHCRAPSVKIGVNRRAASQPSHSCCSFTVHNLISKCRVEICAARMIPPSVQPPGNGNMQHRHRHRQSQQKKQSAMSALAKEMHAMARARRKNGNLQKPQHSGFPRGPPPWY